MYWLNLIVVRVEQQEQEPGFVAIHPSMQKVNAYMGRQGREGLLLLEGQVSSLFGCQANQIQSGLGPIY